MRRVWPGGVASSLPLPASFSGDTIVLPVLAVAVVVLVVFGAALTSVAVLSPLLPDARLAPSAAPPFAYITPASNPSLRLTPPLPRPGRSLLRKVSESQNHHSVFLPHFPYR